MILYHGSYLEIAEPDLTYSRPNVDFGRGFYVTPIYAQASKWCGKFKRRVIERFARQQSISLDAGLDFFYHSEVYPLIRNGVSDMHCMSDTYLAEELEQEYRQNTANGVHDGANTAAKVSANSRKSAGKLPASEENTEGR